MVASFHGSDPYLKSTIHIDGQVRQRRFPCTCSMMEDEEFQQKVAVYSSGKEPSETAKWILLGRLAARDLNVLCIGCTFTLGYLFGFEDASVASVKAKLIDLVAVSS